VNLHTNSLAGDFHDLLFIIFVFVPKSFIGNWYLGIKIQMTEENKGNNILNVQTSDLTQTQQSLSDL
jgi:hypothetical protein